MRSVSIWRKPKQCKASGNATPVKAAFGFQKMSQTEGFPSFFLEHWPISQSVTGRFGVQTFWGTHPRTRVPRCRGATPGPRCTSSSGWSTGDISTGARCTPPTWAGPCTPRPRGGWSWSRRTSSMASRSPPWWQVAPPTFVGAVWDAFCLARRTLVHCLSACPGLAGTSMIICAGWCRAPGIVCWYSFNSFDSGVRPLLLWGVVGGCVCGW